MKKSLITFTIIFTLSLASYSQVTIGKVESKVTEILQKPQAYDSLKDWKTYGDFPAFKQYVGLQVYLPPYKIPSIGDSRSEEKAHLYSNNLTFLPINSSEKSLETRNQSYDSPYYYDKIMTMAYKPYHYYTSNRQGVSPKAVMITNSDSVGNNYYTIIDFIYGEKQKKLESKFRKMFSEQQNKKTYKSDDHIYQLKTEQNPIMMLRNDKTLDTVYTTEMTRFILVPYFTAMKKKYTDQTVIWEGSYTRKEIDNTQLIKYEDGDGNSQTKGKNVTVEINSRWRCKDVTLFEPSYKLTYVLVNDKEESIYIQDIEKFTLLSDFQKREREKKMQAQELANQRKLEMQKYRDEQSKKLASRIAKFTKEYGQELGTLISNHKVKIGMSKKNVPRILGYTLQSIQNYDSNWNLRDLVLSIWSMFIFRK